MSDYEVLLGYLKKLNTNINTVICNLADAGATNFFTGDQVQDANRTHDAGGFDTLVDHQGSFSIVIDTAGEFGSQAFRVENNGLFDSSYFDLQKERATLSTNVGGVNESSLFLDGFVSLVNTNGLIYLSDGGILYANPQLLNSSDTLLAIETTTGRLFMREVSSLPDTDTHFANTNLTFTASRSHDLATFDLAFTNGANLDMVFSTDVNINVTNGAVVGSLIANSVGVAGVNSTNSIFLATVYAHYTGGVFLEHSNGLYNIANMLEYADDATAGAGGRVTGDLYRTATGEVRVKL